MIAARRGDIPLVQLPGNILIAVNDNFDTLTAERSQDGYIVPLKNIINEVYSTGRMGLTLRFVLATSDRLPSGKDRLPGRNRPQSGPFALPL